MYVLGAKTEFAHWAKKMPRTYSGRKIMPERVLGILDAFWQFSWGKKYRTYCGAFRFIHWMPTTHCGHTNIPTTHEQHTNNTSTTHQHTNNTLKTHEQNTNIPTTHEHHTCYWCVVGMLVCYRCVVGTLVSCQCVIGVLLVCWCAVSYTHLTLPTIYSV